MERVERGGHSRAAAQAVSGWPSGGGEMGARIRAHDWAATPLGPSAAWPQSLRTALDLILSVPQPMWIGWGPDLIQLYNDAYSALLDAERHPAALGRPAAETWADIWGLIGPDLDAILAGGPAVTYADRLVRHRRGGTVRDLYFTYSYSPVLDVAAPHGVAGVLCVAMESTAAALRASEARFRSFAESSADTLWIVDAATRQLEYLSPAFERMWGEPREAVLRDLGHWAELVHPDDREQARHVLPRALAGEAVVADYRIVRPSDGAVRWIRDTGFPIRDEGGRVARVAGIAQDITDQEQALEETRRYRTLIEQSSDFIGLADLSGRVIFINDGARRLVGLPPGLDGSAGTIRDFFPPEDWPRVEREILPRLRGGQDWAGEMRFRHVVTGAPIPVWYHAFPLTDAAGRVVALAMLTRDITEQKHAEAALREAHATLERRVAERTAELAAAVEELRMSEERLRLLLEQMPAALWTTDQHLRVTALTGAAVPAALRGITGAAAMTRLAAYEGGPEAVELALAAHRRALGGASVGFDVELAGRTYQAHVEPLRDAAGRGVGTVGVAHDVTDRTLLRLQDEFLALASHELRTPLTPALGYLELAPLALAAGEPERAARYIAEATEQVGRLNDLVGDLLDVGRLRGDKLRLKMGALDLGAVVRRAVEAAGVGAEAQARTIALDIPDAAVLVQGDAGRLEQIVLNLLTNAITHAPRSPTIDVRLRREAGAGRAEGVAVLEVQDYGPGIAPADLPHLFSRFYQVERRDRPSRGGLGLGLYLVQHLVEAHGGAVTVTSTVGTGTTFTVRLPLKAGDGEAAPPATAGAGGGARRTIR